jgi:hypothetical protein
MKSIKTLVKDVENVLSRDKWFEDELQSTRYSDAVGRAVHQSVTKVDKGARLRLSAMGDRCPRSLWASVHAPSVQKRFLPHTRFIFHYGDVVEAMALGLAREAGHSVEGEQDELSVCGVTGRRDCVIDGCTVDVKSVNSRGFRAIKAGLVAEDIFLRSYLDQLDGYTVGGYDDPLVLNKELAYIWAIDKELGHMCLYEHRVRTDRIKQRVLDYRAITERASPPDCTCETVTEGKTGNIRLDTKASYNPFKYFCFPEVRTFIVKGKPIDYTRVVRRPDGVEVDRNGLLVF